MKKQFTHTFKDVERALDSMGFTLERVASSEHRYEVWSNEIMPGETYCYDTLREVAEDMFTYRRLCNEYGGKQETESQVAMPFKKNDGGRFKYFKGNAGDCVTRAIAIASGRDYKQVYDELFKVGDGTPRDGVHKKIWHQYLIDNGWQWKACMGIGTGCQVHLKADELPPGTIIVRLSRHLSAVIDRVLHDTYDCSRNGTRCVYGYYFKP